MRHMRHPPRCQPGLSFSPLEVTMTGAEKFNAEVKANRAFLKGDPASYWSANETFGQVSESIPRTQLEEMDNKSLSEGLHKPTVLVRLTHASECASDRRVLAGNKGHDLLQGGGIVLLHEGGGYVIDPGPFAKHLHAGQMVALLPHVTCGSCSYCRAHKQHLCHKMVHLGFHANGTGAEVMSFPPQCVWPV